MPPFPILESKLTPPLTRRGTVPRAALIRRLEASAATPVVTVCAPPGYGKTILLTQWAQRDPRPFLWLSIDEHDNDPAVLLTYLAVALDRRARIDPGVVGALASPGASLVQSVLPRLATALSTLADPIVVVLDDVHLLRSRECLDAVATLVDHLPEGSQMVLTSRGEPSLPLARLRAEGRLTEIGPAQLAMGAGEADALLRATGLNLPAAEIAEIAGRTEGWPMALYLVALSARAHRSDGAGIAVIGANRLLVDYLQSVVLSGLSPAEVRFLTRTAVLDRLSGPLCDALLRTSGSAEVLEALERSNLLLTPLDRHREWYRYHQLFRELLRAALERREPERVGRLLLRAAEWCERNDLPEDAVEYAMEAGDAGHAARLVLRLAFPVYHSGRLATLERWFGWFSEHDLLERYPPIAVLGAWVQAFTGRPAEVERWADAAERGSFEGSLPDGTPSIDGWLALLRAVLCRRGVQQMRADARAALALVPAASVLRAPALMLLGISHLLAGETATADRVLAEAVDAAKDAGSPDTLVVALAERAILAMGLDAWADAEALVEQARTVLRDTHMHDYVTSIVLYAAAARVALQRGDLPAAQADLALAQRLRPQADYALPVYAVQSRLELARTYAALADVAGARTLLREVDDMLRRRPGLGVLTEQAEQMRLRLDSMRADVIGASALTAAELRLLPLLSTHHTFREIGERLSVSPHTVKSHAMSIYRKFGVSSRSEAIQRARHLGLLAA